jgi:hypothetical protein
MEQNVIPSQVLESTEEFIVTSVLDKLWVECFNGRIGEDDTQSTWKGVVTPDQVYTLALAIKR